MRLQNSHGFVSVLVTLTAATAGIVVGHAPAAYAAQETASRPRALLHVAAEPPRLVFSDANPTPGAAPDVGSYSRYLETQIELVTSRLVLEGALQSTAREAAISQLPSIKNQKNPIAWLEQNLRVANLKNTELIEVSLRHDTDCRIEDQPAVINAVVRSYMERVVKEERGRRLDRFETLKKLSAHYEEMHQEQRRAPHSLRSKLGHSDDLLEPENQALSRLLYDLLKQRVKLNLDRAEAETLLDRRTKGSHAAADQPSKETEALRDKLAVLTAQGNALDKELENLRERLRPQPHTLALESPKHEIARIEEALRKINSELEALNINLNAPERIRVVEHAAAPGKPPKG